MLTIHVLPKRLKEFLLTHPLYKSPKTQIPHRAENPMRNHYTMYICSEQIYVIEKLPPRRWTADDIAVHADGDLIRQLAFRGQVSRNVLVIRSRPFQVLAQARMGIENQNAFPSS